MEVNIRTQTNGQHSTLIEGTRNTECVKVGFPRRSDLALSENKTEPRASETGRITVTNIMAFVSRQSIHGALHFAAIAPAAHTLAPSRLTDPEAGNAMTQYCHFHGREILASLARFLILQQFPGISPVAQCLKRTKLE